MNNNMNVEQYSRKEFDLWLKKVGEERAERLLRTSGLSKSLVYKLMLNTYPHRIGKLGTLAIKRAMLKK